MVHTGVPVISWIGTYRHSIILAPNILTLHPLVPSNLKPIHTIHTRWYGSVFKTIDNSASINDVVREDGGIDKKAYA